MSAIGKMTSRMAKVNKNGKMVLSIRAAINQARNREKGHSSGVMIVPIRVISMKIISMVMASMYGKMAEYMRDNGIITRCMERANLHGLMVGNMRGST
jgi:hypothetical protein